MLGPRVDPRALRRRAVPAIITVALTTAGVSLGACTETPRPLGEDCFRDQDCVSGLCSALKCVAGPPDAAFGEDAGIDVSFDAPADSPADSAGEDAGDAPADAPSDGLAESSVGG
jgi:hypothetical protein